MKNLLTLIVSAVLFSCGLESTSQIQVVNPELGEKLPEQLSKATVAIYRGERFVCTGVLVEKARVLTAAHCFISHRVPSDFTVRHSDFEQPKSIASIRTLADTSDGRVEESFFPNYDVAIVDMVTSIDNIEPVKVFRGPLVSTVDETVIVAGYGRTRFDQADAGVLRHGTARVKRAYDKGMFQGVVVIDNNFQSAPCSGDSGGPLFILQDDQWRILGLTHGVHWYSNFDYLGFEFCTHKESTYVNPGAHTFADFSLKPKVEKNYNSFTEYCENGDLTREELSFYLGLALESRKDICAEFEDFLAQGRLNLEGSPIYSLEPLRHWNGLLSRLDLETEPETDLSALGESTVEHLKLRIHTQAQVDQILETKGLKQLVIRSANTGFDWRKLEDHRNLLNLDLQDLGIEGLPNICQNRDLRRVNLTLNSLNSIAFLDGCQNLEEVFLSSNQIQNLSGLSSPETLRVIIASNNRIRAIDELQGHRGLEFAAFSNNLLTTDQQVCPVEEELEGDICSF
ncbi:trypsin-like serine protease [Pseudobacteriovorax antillogorgiicola]|uniref:V8-like Glu-specific endopeptidase n=1 Tax=Pseudobacteriovorax antillogorgiicola TaxID=1513793 RepID=A0A1Y6CSW3_9BACT|nr:trypsin-like serine protease [Pseudobacteriovorax antillogorgiicola]TCS45866.1 V8-like Glu-specific endopeptidase [Pseudobacteriovorax antillogorgiicola]SMF71315.1 V8-like Glu-specific endopeptidase [Pseudobacteriovorax antillogorgiicola]